MVTTKDILDLLETVAPAYMKEDWDNVGLNCGRMGKEVKTILMALDPFEEVCKEAKDVGADLLVTHHALIWEPGFITEATAQGRNTLFLIENGSPCINAPGRAVKIGVGVDTGDTVFNEKQGVSH